MGACTYDVCTGREEAGTPKVDAVRKLSKGGRQTRGEGVKIFEHFADVICTWPLGLRLRIIVSIGHQDEQFEN